MHNIISFSTHKKQPAQRIIPPYRLLVYIAFACSCLAGGMTSRLLFMASAFLLFSSRVSLKDFTVAAAFSAVCKIVSYCLSDRKNAAAKNSFTTLRSNQQYDRQTCGETVGTDPAKPL